MSYSPDPLHTRHVCLPHELSGLREILAEHVHDLWCGNGSPTDGCTVLNAMIRRSHIRASCLTISFPSRRRRTIARRRWRPCVKLVHGYRIVPPAGAVEPVVKTSQVERELAALRELVFAAHGRDSRSLITCWRATAPDSALERSGTVLPLHRVPAGVPRAFRGF